jgi:hypothetical protein
LHTFRHSGHRAAASWRPGGGGAAAARPPLHRDHERHICAPEDRGRPPRARPRGLAVWRGRRAVTGQAGPVQAPCPSPGRGDFAERLRATIRPGFSEAIIVPAPGDPVLAARRALCQATGGLSSGRAGAWRTTCGGTRPGGPMPGGGRPGRTRPREATARWGSARSQAAGSPSTGTRRATGTRMPGARQASPASAAGWPRSRSPITLATRRAR